MHCANFSPGSTLDAAVLGLPDDPQAAMKTAQPKPRRVPRMIWAHTVGGAVRIYLPKGATFAPGPPNLHAVAACLTAGEFMSIELGIARK